MEAVEAPFNQEKALAGAFSVIVKLQSSRRFVSSSTALPGASGGPETNAEAPSGTLCKCLLAPDMKLFGNYLYKTSNIYLEYLHSDKALPTYLVDIGLLTFLRYNFQFLLFSNDIMSAEIKPQMCS